MKEDFVIRLTKKQLETIGDNSLTGMLVSMNVPSPPAILVIESELWSYKKRREAGGPDYILIPEYVPMCLMQNVVSLVNMGYKLIFREWINDKSN